MNHSLRDKHVLVTGAGRGLGRAIAMAFAGEACEVLAVDLSEDDLVALTENQTRVRARALDVTDAEAVRAAVGEVARLDILVNCAGVILRDGQELTESGFEQVVNVNLHGTMRMCYACRPLLAESQGCVLNLASMLTFFGSGSVPAYSASKGAIAQLTKSLAIAWAADGIRVNAIAPGWIKTGLTQELYEDRERHDAIVRRTPMGRWGHSDDVCGAAVFLCSAAAAFITGAVLPVDGGYSIA